MRRLVQSLKSSFKAGRGTSNSGLRLVSARHQVLGAVSATSAMPALVESVTHLTSLRGFAGTSVLIIVGVATDTARRTRAEQAMAKYQVDKLYDDLKNM